MGLSAAEPGRPSRERRLAAVVAAVAAVPVVLVGALWAGTNLGTVAALVLAAVVWVPPFVLFWGETRGRPSYWARWGWSETVTDRELRRLLDDDSGTG